MNDKNPLRALPPVHEVLDHGELTEAMSRLGRKAVVGLVRRVLDEARTAIGDGLSAPLDAGGVASRAAALSEAVSPRLRHAINATGILLNTGLGRAPLADAAVEAVARVSRGYCNLEFDLDSGDRANRTGGVAAVLRQITGAEAATVVNNNAAATILVLRALAAGREVVVSRG